MRSAVSSLAVTEVVVMTAAVSYTKLGIYYDSSQVSACLVDMNIHKSRDPTINPLGGKSILKTKTKTNMCYPLFLNIVLVHEIIVLPHWRHGTCINTVAADDLTTQWPNTSATMASAPERLTDNQPQCTSSVSLKPISLLWRHNGRDGVSNHQPHDCLLNCLFRRRSKKISKLRVTGLCAGNSPQPVNSPHKWPVTRKMFPFGDVIMFLGIFYIAGRSTHECSAAIDICC